MSVCYVLLALFATGPFTDEDKEDPSKFERLLVPILLLRFMSTHKRAFARLISLSRHHAIPDTQLA